MYAISKEFLQIRKLENKKIERVDNVYCLRDFIALKKTLFIPLPIIKCFKFETTRVETRI